MITDEEYKGVHIFKGITLIEIKPSFQTYGIFYRPSSKFFSKGYHIFTITYRGFKYKFSGKSIPLKDYSDPKIMGKINIEGKTFLMIGENK